MQVSRVLVVMVVAGMLWASSVGRAQRSADENLPRIWAGAYTAESSTPQALAAEVQASYERWGALIRQAGITKQ